MHTKQQSSNGDALMLLNLPVPPDAIIHEEIAAVFYNTYAV